MSRRSHGSTPDSIPDPEYWEPDGQKVFGFFHDYRVCRDQWGRRAYGLTFTFWSK